VKQTVDFVVPVILTEIYLIVISSLDLYFFVLF
jgi:hypothetical protein